MVVLWVHLFTDKTIDHNVVSYFDDLMNYFLAQLLCCLNLDWQNK